MDSWSGNCPFEPLLFPLPFQVLTCVSFWFLPSSQVRPPSVERLMSNAIWYGGGELNAWPTKKAVPSGPNATAGSPPASYAPVPGTLGSFVYFVTPGRNPSGNVRVHVFPPSNVAFTAQPSL